MNISSQSSQQGLDFILYFFNLINIDAKVSDSGDYLFISYNEIDRYESVSAFRCVVFYDLFHLDDYTAESTLEKIKNFPHKRKIYLTVNFSKHLLGNDCKIVQWDVLRNRTQAVYLDKNIDLNRVWYYASPNSYKLDNIDFSQPRTRKFIYQCRSLNARRIAFHNLATEYADQGYISNVFLGQVLDSQDPDQKDWNVSDPNQGLYVPIANRYYNNSYLSVYVESSFNSVNCVHVTEKTWEPLLKGHFILPYSNPYYLERLRNIGFRFPDFIDYSYDSVECPETRFKMVTEEFKRIVNLDLHSLYLANQDVILHNRRLLESMPYDDSAKILTRC